MRIAKHQTNLVSGCMQQRGSHSCLSCGWAWLDGCTLRYEDMVGAVSAMAKKGQTLTGASMLWFSASWPRNLGAAMDAACVLIADAPSSVRLLISGPAQLIQCRLQAHGWAAARRLAHPRVHQAGRIAQAWRRLMAGQCCCAGEGTACACERERER